MQASIRLDVLKAVRLAASREETRHYLNGVCVEIGPRGVDYIATDGNILLAYHSEVGRVQAGVDANGVSVYRPGPDNDLCGAWIIPDAIIDAIKVGKRDSTVGRLSGEGGLTLTISRAGSSFGFVAIDGIFPNWRRVMPRSNEFDKGESLSSNENITFNVDYLKV